MLQAADCGAGVGGRDVPARRWLTIQNAKVDARQLPRAPGAGIRAVFVGPMLEVDGRELDSIGIGEASV